MKTERVIWKPIKTLPISGEFMFFVKGQGVTIAAVASKTEWHQWEFSQHPLNVASYWAEVPKGPK